MLRNILKKPTFAAFKLALGVVLTTTSTIGSLPTADRSWAQSSPSATPSSELEPPQDTPSMTKLRVDGSSSMAMVNKTLKQRYEKQFPGANVELKAEGTDLALQDVRNGEIEVAAIGRPLTAEEKANDLQEKRLNREKIAIIVRVDNPYRGNMTYQEFAKIFRGEITDWSEVGGSPGSIRLVDRPENSDTRQAFRGYSIFQEQEFATGATAEQIVADSTDETIEKLGKDGIGYAIASQVMDRDDVWVVPMHQTLPDDPRYPFSQPRTYIYKGAASPATAAFLGLAGVVGQESIAGAATVPPTGGDSPIAASIPPTTGAAIPGEAPTITTSPIAAVPPNPGSPAPTAGSPVAVPPPQPKPPSSTETPAIVAAQPKTAQAPEATPSPMETASLPPSAGTDIPGLIGNNSILPDFWWMLPIGLVALLVWWGVRKLRSQQTSQLPPGDGSTPPVAPSNTAALPPSSAPDVSTLPSGEALTPADLWDTPATPPAAETNPPTVGLAGGAIAGGLAASAISSREPDEPTTPPEAEPSTTADTAIASSGAHTAATSSTIENANLEGSGERPSTAMPPQATEAPTTTDANVATAATTEAPTTTDANIGTAATAALAGGLAASEMVGGVGDDELASQTSVPSLEPETEAQTAIPASSSQLEETTAEQPIETPEAEIPPTTTDANIGTAATAALAGGLAASEMVGSEYDDLAPEGEESSIDTIETEDTESISAASISENIDIAAAEDRLTTETETPADATKSDAEDFNLAAGAAASGAGLPGGAAAGAALGAIDDLVEPNGADEFVPSASGADEWVPSGADEVVPSSAGQTDDAIPVPASLIGEFDRPSSDTPDLTAASAAAGAAAGVPIDFEPSDALAQSEVEAAKFDMGQSDFGAEELASVDEGLPDLPDGYGESRIVLVPSNPQWAYAYWDISNEDKEELRRQGGSQLALRFYDVTDLNIAIQVPHSLQQYACDEMARDWYLPVPAGDRDYIVEIGYVANDGRWLSLVRSQPIRVPPFYPCDWQNDRFATVPWNEELSGGKTMTDLGTPQRNLNNGNSPVYDSLFAMAQAAEAQRVAGSELLSGMGVFPSGAGLISGMGMSGMGMSGMGMSGIGFHASMPPMRSRKFWLVADAELIVYGATEPDATVTVGGIPVPLSPDGTFRFQMAFPDGSIDYPIMAVAADGQQNRSIHMNFNRETRHRNTNTKKEAEDEIH
ncbi:MAG: DUF4912 domain-containing protein [Geitlerinemataceae cyanobacterium]